MKNNNQNRTYIPTPGKVEELNMTLMEIVNMFEKKQLLRVEVAMVMAAMQECKLIDEDILGRANQWIAQDMQNFPEDTPVENTVLDFPVK